MIGAGLFPLLIYVSTWPGGPGSAAAVVSSVEDFILFNSACYYESDYVNDNLRLRDLVAASDVIIKAFAGDGNYLRPELAASGKETNGRGQPESHGRRNRTASEQHQREGRGNEENGNASSISEADFVLRLEPTIVYKGNEVYKKLKLINWQHYVVIKSIAGSKLRRSPATTSSSSAQGATVYISSHRSKCNRTRLITRNINNSSSGTTEVHAESRTFNSSTRTTTTTTTKTQDNKLSRSKQTSNTSNNQQRHGDENTAENNTREPHKVSSVFGEILPTELIIFGRLDDTGNLQVDLFSGLLHWDEHLQSAIWRELGWSDWSEYTPCSVSCGKGVQQRFRHCLKSPQAGDRGDDTASSRGRTMSSTRATPFRQRPDQPKPYVNIEQHPRKDGVMNNENVNPSSLFTTPLTASTMEGQQSGGAGGEVVEPTVAFTTEDGSAEDGEDGDGDEEDGGAEPPAGRDTPASTADLHPAIERHFNESTNANSGERSSPVRRLRRRQQKQQHNGKKRSQLLEGGGKKHITAAAATDSGCEGYNIEQRSCNMFECTGSLDLLTASDGHQTIGGQTWDNKFNDHISQMEKNFTLMINLRSKKRHLAPPSNQDFSRPAPTTTTSTPHNILSLRSSSLSSQLGNASSGSSSSSSSLSINFANDGHGGLKVIQEKFGLSEMLPVERNLLDGKWHSVALSGRNGGYINVYIDCRWANSFVLSRGAIELPQYPVIEAGHDIELGQLTLVPGDTVRLQCATDTIPITDIENRQVTSYFEGIN